MSLAGSYNGLTFGPGGDVHVAEVTGIYDLPQIRAVDNSRGSDHGNWPTTDRAGGRTIVYTWLLIADTPEDFASLRDRVIAAVTVEDAELPLLFDGNTRLVHAKPRRRLFVSGAQIVGGQRTGEAIVEFVASDARIYSATELSASTGFPEVSGGRTYPRTYPWSYGAIGSGGRLNVTNEGNTPAPWTIRFTGPWVNPTIEHVGLGKVLRLAGSVAAGQTLTVSSKFPRSVLLDAAADRYSWFTQTPDWFDLLPGPNEIRVGGSSGSGTAELVDTRSAWI